MNFLYKSAAIACVALGLSACSTFDPATRSAPMEAMAFQPVEPSFDVTELRIQVPKDLRVSEANSYYPVADIVWRGDPIGDRHKQVLDIFATAMQRGTDPMDGVQDVAVDISVRRFHSLTEKARYTIGGVHSIRFRLTVRDAATGEVIIPERTINGDLAALGGRAAVAAEAQGITQKSRILDHLSFLISEELSRPIDA